MKKQWRTAAEEGSDLVGSLVLITFKLIVLTWALWAFVWSLKQLVLLVWGGA